MSNDKHCFKNCDYLSVKVSRLGYVFVIVQAINYVKCKVYLNVTDFNGVQRENFEFKLRFFCC